MTKFKATLLDGRKYIYVGHSKNDTVGRKNIVFYQHEPREIDEKLKEHLEEKAYITVPNRRGKGREKQCVFEFEPIEPPKKSQKTKEDGELV